MVKKMNKEEFINVLTQELNYSEEKCVIINEVLENTFFIGKKGKEKVIEEFMNKLDINEEEANHIYEVVCEILKDGVKEKLKHPFRSQD